jgi:hypothetical protein
MSPPYQIFIWSNTALPNSSLLSVIVVRLTSAIPPLE